MLVEKFIDWGARMCCNRYLSLIFDLHGDFQMMGALKLNSKFGCPVRRAIDHMVIIYKWNHRRFNLWIFIIEVNRVAKFRGSIGAGRRYTLYIALVIP